MLGVAETIMQREGEKSSLAQSSFIYIYNIYKIYHIYHIGQQIQNSSVIIESTVGQCYSRSFIIILVTFKPRIEFCACFKVEIQFLFFPYRYPLT